MKKRELMERIEFQLPISFSLLLAVLGLYLCAFFSHIWILFVFLLASVILSAFAHALYARTPERLSGADRIAVVLLVSVYALCTVSLLSFSLRTFIFSGPRVAAVVTLLMAVVFLAMTVLEAVYLVKVVGVKRNADMPRGSVWRRVLPVAIVAAAIVALNIEIFGGWLRWDSYDYFYWFKNLSYSGLTKLANLRPANHAAYGCSVIYLLIDGIIGDAHVSLLMMNVLAVVVGTFAFWRIGVKMFPHWKPVSHALYACIYAFSPFIFGLSWSINLEAFLMLGLVLFFWGEVERLPLIQTGAALLICFSKETGAVLLAAIMAVRLLMNFLSRKKRDGGLVSKLELGVSLPVLACGLFWVVDFFVNSWVSSNSSWIPTTTNVNFNSFGLNLIYIGDRIITLIFTNFTWLIIALVAAGFIIGRVRRARAATEERHYFAFELLAGLGASLVPLLFFVTYNHIRYAGPTAVLLLLLLPEALDRMKLGVRLRSVICGALAALYLAQCYVTVDPMMYLFCGTMDKGTGRLAFAKNNILVGGSDATSVSVDAQYNRELMYFDRALDGILRAIEYDDDTVIIISDEYREATVSGYVGAEYLIMGFGYPHMPNAAYISWNAQKGERYLSSSKSDEINILYTSNLFKIYNAINEYEDCIYITFSFSDPSKRERFLYKYKHEVVAEERTCGWEMTAYKLTSY